MRVLGIDPGLDGACCVLDPSMSVSVVQFLDTPTLTVQSKTGTRREYDLAAMKEWVYTMCPDRAVIENVHAMPGQGVRSMFTMGYGVGAWEGILAALRIPFQRVTPQRWRKRMLDGMGKDKDASRLQVIRRYPGIAGDFARKKDHGRADALLLAEYGALEIYREVFLPPRPFGCEVRHLDGDRTHNAATNLAWGSRAENAADRARHGRTATGTRNGATKLTPDAVRDIRVALLAGTELKALAKTYGVAPRTIARLRDGRTWRRALSGGRDGDR